MTQAERQTCSEHAEAATRSARHAATSEEREVYVRIAAVWNELAAIDGEAGDLLDGSGDRVEAMGD